MPNVSQSKLDELESEVTYRREAYENLKHTYDVEYGKVRDFDGILDKIVKVANGQSLYSSGYGMGMAVSGDYGGGCACRPQPSDAERHEYEVRNLHAQIVSLESRLAAAIAVASFAKSK